MTKLIKNGNFWGIRKRVPQDILSTFDKTRSGKPKEDLWLPISKSHREAKNGIPDAETKARDLFDTHRREMGIGTALIVVQPVKRTPQQACEAFYAKLQEIERARRTEILKEAKRQLDEYERLITPRKKGEGMFTAAFLGSNVPSTDFLIVSPDRAARDGLHAALSERLTHDIAMRLANAKGALAVMDLGYVRELSGETDETLLPLLARTKIAFLEAMLRDPGALFGPMPPLGTVRLGMSMPVALKGTNADDDPLFSEMADEWFKERIGPSGKDWSTERRRIWNATRDIFREVCTDRPISTYRVDDKAELQRVFRSLPSNRNKKLPGKKVREQITIAAERGLPLMDKVTANEYLHLIEGCFDWIKRSKSVMRGINPFEGSAFQVPKSGKKKVRKFEIDELKAIFANPLFAKHADTGLPP